VGQQNQIWSDQELLVKSELIQYSDHIAKIISTETSELSHSYFTFNPPQNHSFQFIVLQFNKLDRNLECDVCSVVNADQACLHATYEITLAHQKASLLKTVSLDQVNLTEQHQVIYQPL